MKFFCLRNIAAVGFIALLPLSSMASTVESKVKVCETCHGVKGQSTNHMFPILAGQHAQYLKKQLLDFKNGKRSDPSMNGFAKTLSDKDIAQISEYFSSVNVSSSN